VVDPVTERVNILALTPTFISDPVVSEFMYLKGVPIKVAFPPTLFIVVFISPVIVSLDPVPYPVTTALNAIDCEVAIDAVYREAVGIIADKVEPDV
jgi:hypothetical protein